MYEKMSSDEYEVAVAFMKQFHSRQVSTGRPSSTEAPCSGGLSFIMEDLRSISISVDSRVVWKNRIVRTRTVECLVDLERRSTC
jgi:hypothetical protein